MKKKAVKKTGPLMQTKPAAKPAAKPKPKPVAKTEEPGFFDKVKSYAKKIDRALEGNTSASNDTFMGYHIYGPKTGQKVKK
ncbi:MAG: hypothetical protein ACOVOQ_11790 [Flavobacterium sp.]